jgi:hypothetical protein
VRTRNRRLSGLLAGGPLILLLIAVLSGCGGHTATSRRFDSGSSGVSVFTPSDSDLTAITDAFNSYEQLPTTCLGGAVTSGSHFGSDGANSWAVVVFERPSNCVVTTDPAPGASTPYTLALSNIAPWSAQTSTVMAVFEAQSGSSWQMNSLQSSPFPCPVPNGGEPGKGNAAIPEAVLQAWGLSYAPNCAQVFTPDEPGR